MTKDTDESRPGSLEDDIGLEEVEVLTNGSGHDKTGIADEDSSFVVQETRQVLPIPLERFKRILVIGLGGIGTALLPHLCRYLVYSELPNRRIPLFLFDGDDFEGRNRERQDFQGSGNKAMVKSSEMRHLFPELSIRAVPEYITPENIGFYIEEGTIIFLAVDNHASRRMLSQRCEGLQSAILISGGNEWSDGNVQVYARWGGKDQTSPLTRFHPEIEEATDTAGLFSCDEAVKSGEPQLLFTNLTAATHMLNTFYALVTEGLRYEEIYFDIIEGKSDSVSRNS